MDVSATLASQSYQSAISAARPDGPGQGPQEPSYLQTMATDFVAEMQKNEQIVADGMVGKADTHSVVTALASTELAVQTAVAVRDKVVEAYQEILRMPV